MGIPKHIKDEIEFLKANYENISIQGLKGDAVLQRASVRSLEIIGEAVKNLSDEYKHKHPTIEWRKIAGFRDILIHHYFGIDWEVVWDVIEHKIPEMDRTISVWRVCEVCDRREQFGRRVCKTRSCMPPCYITSLMARQGHEVSAESWGKFLFLWALGIRFKLYVYFMLLDF